MEGLVPTICPQRLQQKDLNRKARFLKPLRASVSGTEPSRHGRAHQRKCWAVGSRLNLHSRTSHNSHFVTKSTPSPHNPRLNLRFFIHNISISGSTMPSSSSKALRQKGPLQKILSIAPASSGRKQGLPNLFPSKRKTALEAGL
ncbi:hypothetical protein NC651_000266 [Populus alba x Populus x berolinensis]|nr:hypothetical protein NC651_000266 [Populus alba x Populus x berolinensis]